MADEPASPNDWIEKSFARARELEATGLGFGEAFDLAQLERRVDQWPIQWGDDLHVRLFGDFQAPATDIEFKALGIRVSSQKREGTIVYGAYMVLDAVMSTHDKSLTSLLDGIRRLNVLIGAWSLADWGQSTVGWWSHITHGSSGGTIGKLEHEKIEKAAEAALQLSPEVRRKVEAAMYWIRATRHPFQRHYENAILAIYSDYWNAFECLVDAVNIVRPESKLGRREKQQKIDGFLSERSHHLTPNDVVELHRIVSPGLVGKASHALRVCFGPDGDRYIEECFKASKSDERLYEIRNAINHGEIDAEDPKELIRVEARFHRLWMIVFRMFGRFIPYPAPVDPDLKKK